MKFSKSALINFGEFQTSLKILVIAINEEHYIKYINSYAEEMLALETSVSLIDMPVTVLSDKLKIPFFQRINKTNESAPILVNGYFLKWKKSSLQIDNQEWFLLVGEQIISHPENGNKDFLNLAKIIENLPELVYWKDNNYVYKGCNNHVARLLNLACPSDIIGKTDYDFGWSSERIKSLQDVDRDIIEQGINSIVEDIIPVAGLNKIFLTSKTPLHDEHGNITGILGISTDITSRKIMEEELRKSRATVDELERLNNIIKYAPDIIYWKDKDSIYRGGNNQLAIIAGFQNPEDIIGKSDYDFPWRDQAQSYILDDQEVLKSEKPKLDIEDIVKLPDGSQGTVISNKVPLRDSNNNVIGVLGIATDITKRKKMEEDLRHAQKAAEAANEAKSDFISNMQHDLMTPFSGIHGAAAVLYALYVEKYPELKEWLEPMMRSCERWERVHYSMFDVLKLIDPSLEIEEFYLLDEINNVAESMLAFLRIKHLKLLTPASSEVESFGMIKSNRLKVHLIMQTLISNAIKFTDTGQIEVKISCDEELFSIHIEDSGIGIPADKFDYIFDKFTKLSRSNLYAENFKGIGAGLYIARQHARSIGGEIKVSSEVGQGSIFTLILPKCYKL